MVLLTALVTASVAIMAVASAWGWRNGTLQETVQERYDHEFDRIVHRLRRPS